MRRIAIAIMGTISGLVLLFSYHTSRNEGSVAVATSAPAVAGSTGSSGSSGSAGAAPADPEEPEEPEEPATAGAEVATATDPSLRLVW